jgi:hypothetical protein
MSRAKFTLAHLTGGVALGLLVVLLVLLVLLLVLVLGRRRRVALGDRLEQAVWRGGVRLEAPPRPVDRPGEHLVGVGDAEVARV